jgi:hypothetical protein
MNYTIIQLKHTPSKSAHCSFVKQQSIDKPETYDTKILANKRVDKLKLANPKTTYIVAKHWR